MSKKRLILGLFKPFTILNNAIDIEKFSFSQSYRNEIRNELDIDEKCYVIGQVAKLEEQKNPLFLLEIFNEYQKNNPNSKLLIVGEGNLLNEVKVFCDLVFDSQYISPTNLLGPKTSSIICLKLKFSL